MPSPRPIPRTVLSHALLAGAAELLPVPFLDDAVRDRFRRRLAGRLARDHGVPLGREALRVLAVGARRPRPEGLGGCLRATVIDPTRYVVWKLVSKLLRKITIVLAVKEAVDTVSRVIHEGYLLDRALAAEPARAAGAPAAVRGAIEEALAGFDTRPLERAARKALGGGWRLLLRMPRPFLRALQDEATTDAETAGERRVIDELGDDLAARRGALATLAARFDAALDRHAGPPRGAAPDVDGIGTGLA